MKKTKCTCTITLLDGQEFVSELSIDNTDSGNRRDIFIQQHISSQLSNINMDKKDTKEISVIAEVLTGLII